MNSKAYTLTVIVYENYEVESEVPPYLPSEQELAIGIAEGLPDEWFDGHSDGFSIRSIDCERA